MPKRILVLEDQEDLYQLLHDLLTFEGYQIHRPTQFTDLVSELQAHPADAVIADVNLHDVNGIDLVEELRRQDALKDVYVLLTSGMDYRQEALQRGANDFLQKPYMPDELVDLLVQRIGK